MNRIAKSLLVGMMTFAAVACSHHSRSNNAMGGGPSGSESYAGQRKGAGQMNNGDYGMYGDPNVSTSGGKYGSQPTPSTGGGPTSGATNVGAMHGGSYETLDSSGAPTTSSGAPATSSGAPSSGHHWYDDVR